MIFFEYYFVDDEYRREDGDGDDAGGEEYSIDV